MRTAGSAMAVAFAWSVVPAAAGENGDAVAAVQSANENANDSDSNKNGITDEVVTIEKPRRAGVAGDRAHVLVPGDRHGMVTTPGW